MAGVSSEYLAIRGAYPQIEAVLKEDSRIVRISIGLQVFRGGERFVVRAHTIAGLEPQDRKGFRGRIEGFAISYVTAQDYNAIARPAYQALGE